MPQKVPLGNGTTRTIRDTSNRNVLTQGLTGSYLAGFHGGLASNWQGPPKSPHGHLGTRPTPFSTSVGSHQAAGGRAYQEDQVIIQQRSNEIFVGVLDGHDGGDCARFMKARLQSLFREEMTRQPNVDLAFREAYARADDEFLRQNRVSGTTASLVIRVP